MTTIIAHVICKNCEYIGAIELIKGQAVQDEECPNCKGKQLELDQPSDSKSRDYSFE